MKPVSFEAHIKSETFFSEFNSIYWLPDAYRILSTACGKYKMCDHIYMKLKNLFKVGSFATKNIMWLYCVFLN